MKREYYTASIAYFYQTTLNMYYWKLSWRSARNNKISQSFFREL